MMAYNYESTQEELDKIFQRTYKIIIDLCNQSKISRPNPDV
jgi:hypothetical protein